MGSPSGRKGQAKGQHHLLSILCANDHFVFEKKYHAAPSKKVNQVLKMIEEELMLDHYYVQQSQTIVVKIDANTMDNPVLKDW